ncbi:hypothetical protein HYDPIDRAFT_44651 [Hydnomerulius pinastri MD-312]|uniref:G domain-containing protein n=1 Tax=Hydnomerulius pinastri MD-312 TaxID=994086 RepID=A0A0C9W5X1_9AGAM|nr:hypothetical protein HYDPIDRAFT_44651 [Hydnomerulius pinastri MD-312]
MPMPMPGELQSTVSYWEEPSPVTTLNDIQIPPYHLVYRDASPDRLSEGSDYERKHRWARSPSDESDRASSNGLVFEGERPAMPVKKPKNVILFGETGVGKSSVINLMAGYDVAKSSPDLQGCTLEAHEYAFTLGAMHIRVFDTVGLEEPEMGVNTYFGAIDKAHQLITSLHAAGGIDLLLYCVRGARVTATMQKNYRLFYEFLCDKKVPLALVITHLENEEVSMEDWWVRNEQTFKKYGIEPVAHACITAAPARVERYAARRQESQNSMQMMMLNTLGARNLRYDQETGNWLFTLLYRLRSFLKKKETPKKKDLAKALERRCAVDRNEAQRLADMLTKDRDHA